MGEGGGDEERACNNTTDAEQIDFCVVVIVLRVWN